MKLANKVDIQRRIYELSVEDILTIINEDGLELELNEKDISFIEEKVGGFIDWRSAISFALSELKVLRKKNASN